MNIVTYLCKPLLHVINEDLRHKRCSVCCYSFRTLYNLDYSLYIVKCSPILLRFILKFFYE
nr:MAG TPA: Protein of unknown function (DUF983) [Caudoviricetes sp.]